MQLPYPETKRNKSAEDGNASHWVGEEILGALKRVPHEFAEAVVLSDIEGLSYAEIAEITDAAVGTVKSRIFRGRHLLQQDLYRSALEMGYQPKAASPTEP